jgi:hypothetical protein
VTSPTELFANDFTTELAAPCGATDTSIVVVVAAPTQLQGSGEFRVLVDSGTASAEIMVASNVGAGTTWNVARGSATNESPAPTPVPHAAGAIVLQVLTEGGLEQALSGAAAAGSAGTAAETTRAEAAEGTNAAAVSAESARAEGVESSNAGAIATETTRAEAAETAKASSAALAAETARAEAAEGTNAAAVAGETTRAEAAEASRATSGALSGETTRAEVAEAANATAISTETTRAEGAEASRATSSALSSETSRAEGAEGANAAAIASETSRAETAEQANATANASETVRAEAAESSRATSSALSSETTRAEAAEGTNASAISGETARAEGVEAGKAAATALASETSRAESAEGLDAPLAAVLAGLPKVASATTSGNLTANTRQPVSNASSTTAITFALPSTGTVGQLIEVEREDDGTLTTAAAITVTGTIRGAAASSLAVKLLYESIVFVYEGSGSWGVFAGHKTLSSLDARYVAGSVTRAGTGAPANSLGSLGDGYVDLNAAELYGPKANLVAPGAFPSVGITDAFTRVGEDPLSDGGNWTTDSSIYGGAMEISTSGQATPVSGAGGVLWTGGGTLADQDSYFTAIPAGWAAGDYVNVYLRRQSPSTINGYRLKLINTSPTLTAVLYRDSTVLATTFPSTAPASITGLGARIVGSTITCMLQTSAGWVTTQMPSATDATYATGLPGFGVGTSATSIGPVGAGAVTESLTPAWPAGKSLLGAYVTVVPPTGVAATDTPVLQAALAACATAGGGRVVCGAGTYVVNATLTLPAATIIAGAGPQGTVLQLAPGSNTDLVVTAGFASNTGTTNIGIYGFGLENITLDANRANQTSLSRCLVVYGYSYSLRNVWLINGWGTGWYSEWGGSSGSITPMEAFFQAVKVVNYGGTPGAVGIDWNGPHDSQFTNVTVNTLDSTIRYQDATYAATAINGTSAVFPTLGTSFSFATTSAAPVAQYPTSGGSFIVPLATTAIAPATAPPAQPVWAVITYTGASTSGAVTTFTGCTANVGGSQSLYLGSGAHGIAVPTYGIRTNMGAGSNGANGEVYTAVHIWGRNHFALYSTDNFYAANCYAEGAMIANVVMVSGCVWKGGIVLGTVGNTGNQPTEVGFCLGYGTTSPTHARSNTIQGVTIQSFVYPGAAVAFANDAGGNVVQGVTDQAVDATAASPSSLFTGQPSPNDVIQLFEWSAVSSGLWVSPITTPGSSFQTFTQVSESISNVVVNGSTVTITTATAFPNLQNGNTVYVSGITGITATTAYTVSAVSGTSFTITAAGASWTSGGTITQTSFTFTVPANCTSAAVTAIGAGGGAQAGGVQAAGVANPGGGGGGGGGISQTVVKAIPYATVPITVGNAGLGGVAVSTNSTIGTVGTIGTQSTYGSAVSAQPGVYGSASVGGAGGIGVTQAGGVGASSNSTGAGPSTTAGASGGGGGGGAGGGLTTGNVTSNGSIGGKGGALTAGGIAGVGAAGGNGTSTATSANGGGGGGGGGASSTTGGYAGGNAGSYGGGGGGGGATQNGSTSGPGGNGAPGIVIVSTW